MYKDDKKAIIIMKKYSVVFSFIIASFAMLLMLFLSGMLGNGKYVILRGDLLEQYVGDIRMFARSLRAGESPFFQYCVSMGFPAVLPIALEVINPFNLLFLLFYNSDVNLITVIIIILKTGVIAASFHFFMKKIYRSDFVPSVIISVFYSMCGFVVVYGTISFFWMDVLYIFPLCAVAVNKAVHGNKYHFLIPVFSYAFITQFFMGYLTGIFGLLYFLLILFIEKHEMNFKMKMKEIAKFFLVSFIAVLISGIVWVPVASFLLRYNATDRTSFSGLQIGWMEILNNLFWGEFQNLKHAPYIYCGIPCLVVSPFYFINNKINRREKIIYGSLLLFFFLGCIVGFLYQFLHGFDAPDSFYYRFSFIISFLLCIISCRQIPYMKEVGSGKFIIWILALCLLYLVEERLQLLEIGGLSNNTPYYFVINFALIGLWTGLYALYEKSRKNRKAIIAVIVLFSVLETALNGYVCIFSNNAMENSGVTYKEFKEWEREYTIALNNIRNQENGQDFYRINFWGDLTHNSDSYWGYNGLTDFCTAENEQLRNILGDFGFYTYKRSTYATGITSVMEMLLAVKYSGRLYSEYATEGKNYNPELYQSKYYLPIGYMADKAVLEDLPLGENVFENQNILVKSLSGVENVFERVPDERIERKEEGLTISADNNLLSGYGEMYFIANDVYEPVYLQIEQQRKLENGIYFGSFENMVSPYDSMVSIPFSVKMNKTEDGRQFVSLWSDYDFRGELSISGVNIYSLNEERLQEAYNILNQERFNITECKNGIIKGVVKVGNADKILMTSLPVSDGWKVYLNDKQIEPLKAVNGTFFAVSFPNEGEYIVEFRYSCPGLKAGVIITGIGVLLATIYFCINRLYVERNA